MATTKNTQAPKIDGHAGVKALAYRIARDLMTSGAGGEILGDHLVVMTRDGRDLGGWGLDALAKRIKKHLAGEL